MADQQSLAHLLRERGVVPADWAATVAAVDRGLFIPARFEGSDLTADPEGWHSAVYADAPVVTQVNDGRPTAAGDFRLSTSSSSMPSLMLEMLTLLDVHEGHRVLEIGTGTGYNAAWLSHRLGAEKVTSVEWDEGVLASARASLARAGLHPTTVLGDGRQGHPPRAPYDRVLCTCTMRDIPAAWLTQCPTGRIVTPWGSSFFSGSFATLDVTDGEGIGTFSGYPAFMWDRAHRAGSGDIAAPHPGEEGKLTTTDIPPQNVIQDAPAFFTSLFLTDVRYRWCEADDGSGEATLWFRTDDTRCWAAVEYAPGQNVYEVEQYGPRALWDEVRQAYLRWHALGCPPRSRFGLHATATGQTVWLDDSANVITQPTPERPR
ncbi:methyltransferase domain-containing protein [Streptomyces sp. JJ66]|uniref:methyltransferase domain-containing protein n=1 Tax=Streptomyces sp. JJ66 TaxID=2803843 RepID=UPI001C59F033|nr:methyltransferase domain-containing protein [Streptomyces sp. JJ66]MBW1604523.1 methyltransferase domain-containing protein [Streptomyces sp. JJ66]